MLRTLLVLSAVVALLAPGQARAQGAAPLDGEESPELRALRLSELELFGPSEPLVVIEPSSAPLPAPLGTVPGALTSDAPPPHLDEGASGEARDLSWLSGLMLPDIPVRWDDRVVRYLEYFRDDPRGRSIIRSWMARRERWGELIRRTLREEGLPEDLLYVAMVESGFTADARSDAGAVGPWQFVSRTGEEYGLTQSHWIDLRRDPEASTRAAARYLGALHARFGTWELALAAYNMGYGALLRSMRKYDTNDYWELTRLESALPFETSLYVSKIIACAIVAQNLDRFGLEGLEMEAPMRWDSVEVPGGTALSALARAADTTVAELRRLNPALRRDRVPPGGDAFAIRLPEGTGERFAARWERSRPRDGALVEHEVRFGERLADVAYRYRTTERALRETNELGDADDVAAGVVLMVPAVEPREPAAAEPPVVGVREGTFVYADRRRVFYRCHRGEELAAIAAFFDVTADEIGRWNRIDRHAELQDGMFLQLFVPSSVDLGRAVVLTPDEVRIMAVGSEEFFAHHAASDGRVRFRYRVAAGDTLSTIGARFGISVGSLCRINLIGRDAVLRVGQEIVVYAEPSRVPAELAPSAEPIAAAEEAAAASSPPEGAGAATSGGAAAEDPGAPSADGPSPAYLDPTDEADLSGGADPDDEEASAPSEPDAGDDRDAATPEEPAAVGAAGAPGA
jgi:membrane-bound lytic murein transglycosylase D